MWLSLRLVGHRIRSGPISLEQPSTQQIWGQFAEKRGLPPIYFNPRKINTYLRQKKGVKYDFVSIIAVQNSAPSIWPAPQLAPFIRRVCSSLALRPILGSRPWIRGRLELSGMGDDGDADGMQLVLTERG